MIELNLKKSRIGRKNLQTVLNLGIFRFTSGISDLLVILAKITLDLGTEKILNKQKTLLHE